MQTVEITDGFDLYGEINGLTIHQNCWPGTTNWRVICHTHSVNSDGLGISRAQFIDDLKNVIIVNDAYYFD